MRAVSALTAIVFAALAVTVTPARGEEPPIPPVDFEARAAVVQDPLVGCTLIDKSFDAARTTLTYNLRLTNKTAKPIVKVLCQVTWRDAAGTNLRWTVKNEEFNKPLAPGATATRNEVDDAPKDGDPQKRAEWEKEASGLTEVRLSVIAVTFADGTTEVQQVKRNE
jgi:hypothetical protein